MHTHHEDFSPPSDPNAIIWRYLDVARYLSLDHSVSMPAGILAPASLEMLVQEVVLAPRIPEWHRDAIQKVTTDLGFAFLLRPSALSGKGFLG